MNVSIDLILIVVNLLALAFSYGRFSEKISSIEKKLSSISDSLSRINAEYYTLRDGNRLEDQIKTMWKKVDECPCHSCSNFTKRNS